MAQSRALLAALAIAAAAAQAPQTLVMWTFDATPSGYTTTPTDGVAAASASITALGGTSFASGGAAGVTGQAVSITTSWPAQGAGNATAGAQWCVSTVGYTPSNVTFSARISSTAPTHRILQYRTAVASAWMHVGWATSSAAGVFDTYSLPIPADPAAANAAGFCLRIVAVFAPGTSAYAAPSSYGTGEPGCAERR